MAAPVWVLSVDLQTKTAAFTTGLSDAAKNARGSFNDIKDGAREAGEATSFSMMEARHSVMILGEEFGIHLPRALSGFIASLGPIGPAMEAAFPFLAIALGATLLIEHLTKLREEAEKLEQSQRGFETTTLNAFNSLDQKLLQAEIRTDELRKDHVAALRHELQLIDMQTMGDLVHEFDILAKAADAVFAELKSHWYTGAAGATGAKHALEDFKSQYDLLLAQGKDKEASDLLAGTKQSAITVLEAMKSAREEASKVNHPGTGTFDAGKYGQDIKTMRAANVHAAQAEIEAQETLVGALNGQVTIEGKILQLKKAQADEAVANSHKHAGHGNDQLMRAEAEEFRKGQEIEQREWEEHYRAALGALETNEKEKIDATQQGSQARLNAVNAAIKQEDAYGLQETGFYRSLLVERVNITREMSEEQARLQAEAGKEAAQHGQKMAELQLAADKEAGQVHLGSLRITEEQRVAMETDFANRDLQLKTAALQKEIDALDKNGKDYDNKLKALQDKETELVKAHENELTAIKDKAEQERNARILSAEDRFNDEVARGLTSVLMRHQSFAAMMTSLGDQVASGMIENALKSMLADDMTKEKDAAFAARQAFKAGWQFPWPTNIVMAPVMGAAAFAATMAFADGTDMVPGVGRGDIVPAMLEPGEGIVPGGVMDKLSSIARSGGLDGGARGNVHLHYRPTYHVSAIDGPSVRGMLKQHSDEFSQHFHGELRKLNK